MRLFLIFVASLFMFDCFSQNDCSRVERKLKKLEKLLLTGDDIKIDQLLSELDFSCTNHIILNTIGDICFYMKKFEKAQSFYFESFRYSNLSLMHDKSLLHFLTSLYEIGNYERFDMIVNNNNFHIRSSYSTQFKDLIEKNGLALSYKKDSIDFQPVSLSINSESDEYFASMPIDSDIIIYTYRDNSTSLKDENFFISRKQDDLWSEPVKLGSNINSDYREGSLSVSLDGKDLFFASCNRPNSYGGCDLYYSTLINDTVWSDSYNLGPIINTKFWESQPSVSGDGNMLFFASNRNGGYGGSDIWVSKKINDIWIEPVNLGPEVNTPGDEYTPFLHYDNSTFYFASRGHHGMGGFDLYMGKLNSSLMVSNITNLGYPINTHHDESGLIVSKNGIKAYYNSNINGNLDIYAFDLPNKFKSDSVALINGLIMDSISRLGLAANIFVSALDYEWQKRYISDDLGQFSFTIPMNSAFSLNVSAEKYDFFEKKYYLLDDQGLKKVIVLLDRLRLGNKINLNNIYYEFNDFSLKRSSLVELKNFAKYLNLNSTLKVEIRGHTDNIGSVEYNYQLSEKRAKSVYDALILFGVNPFQLTYKGFGYDNPLVSDDSDLARLKNRRTEVIVTGYYGK